MEGGGACGDPLQGGVVQHAVVLIDDDVAVPLDEQRRAEEVFRRRRHHGQTHAVADVERLAVAELVDGAEAERANLVRQRRRGKVGDDDARRPGESTQRLDVEVIGVGAAEEQRRGVVELGGDEVIVRRKRVPAPEIRATRREPGIADDAGRSEPDVEPEMTEEGDGGSHGLRQLLKREARMNAMKVEVVTLEGARIRLEPLTEAHHLDLSAVGLDDDIWRWSPKPVRTPGEMALYIAVALAERAAGRALPFAVIDKATGRAIGSTRYGAIEPAHRRVEIGWTWLARPSQRTAANTEAKYLLLRHAFETL